MKLKKDKCIKKMIGKKIIIKKIITKFDKKTNKIKQLRMKSKIKSNYK
jgi:hypothetical protein